MAEYMSINLLGFVVNLGEPNIVLQCVPHHSMEIPLCTMLKVECGYEYGSYKQGVEASRSSNDLVLEIDLL